MPDATPTWDDTTEVPSWDTTTPTDVVRVAPSGSLTPNQLLPAVRLIGGQVLAGEPGDTHPDIIKREGVSATDLDQRGFQGPGGLFFDRESAAQALKAPTEFERGRLHSTDLSRLQEPGGVQKQLEEAAAGEAAKPLISLPTGPGLAELPQTLTEKAVTWPTKAVLGQKAADIHAQIFRELYNTAKSVPEFLSTEEGMLALLASTNPIGRVGVTAYFTKDMAKNLLDQAKELGGKWDELSTLEKVQAVTRAAGTLGLTALLGKAALGEGLGLARPLLPKPAVRPTAEVPPVIEEPAKAPPVPVTPEAPMEPRAEAEAKAVEPSKAPEVAAEEAKPKTLTPAIISDEGNIIETAANHGTARLKHARAGRIAVDLNKEGYVDENGNFLTRNEGAKRFEEITGKKPKNPESLTSEDLREADLLGHLEKPPPTEIANVPTMVAGDHLVTIERTEPDGTVTRYIGAFNPAKNYDLRGIKGFDAIIPQIGKVTDTGWSHGLLAKNERIIEDGGKTAMVRTPVPKSATPSTPIEAPRNWELFYENLTDELDSFKPARETGRIDYDLNDAASRFVDYAKSDKSGKSLDKLVGDFSKTDEATSSQIRKLRQSIKSILAKEQQTIPVPTAKRVPATLEQLTAKIEAGEKLTAAQKKRYLALRKAAVPAEPERAAVMAGPGAAPLGEPPYSAASQLADQLRAAQPVGTREKLNVRERLADAWSKGKTTTDVAVGRALAIGQTIKETFVGRKPTDMDPAISELDWLLQHSAAQSRNMGRAILAQQRSPTLRRAAALWIDTPGDAATKRATLQGALANLPARTPGEIRRAIELAANLPPEGIQFAESLRQYYGIREQDAITHGIFGEMDKKGNIIRGGLDDYFTHVWGDESNMPGDLRAALSNGRVSTYFANARHRTLGTFLDGIMQGKVPELDPASVVPRYNYTLDRAIASRQFIKNATDNIVAPDGRAALAPTGIVSRLGDKTAPDATLIRPKGRTEDMEGYKFVDHPALRKWKWAVNDENGNPILSQNDLPVQGLTALSISLGV